MFYLLIYNSRNSKDLIVTADTFDETFDIYNSRNSKDLIVDAKERKDDGIYNSRNSKDLIVIWKKCAMIGDLQQ